MSEFNVCGSQLEEEGSGRAGGKKTVPGPHNVAITLVGSWELWHRKVACLCVKAFGLCFIRSCSLRINNQKGGPLNSGGKNVFSQALEAVGSVQCRPGASWTQTCGKLSRTNSFTGKQHEKTNKLIKTIHLHLKLGPTLRSGLECSLLQ